LIDHSLKTHVVSGSGVRSARDYRLSVHVHCDQYEQVYFWFTQ